MPVEQLHSSPIASASLEHELGLVSSSAGADYRYIGASSGCFLAKLILSTVGDEAPTSNVTGGSHLNGAKTGSQSNGRPSSEERILDVSPAPLPTSWERAKLLSATYFDTVQLQFPFLHGPSYEQSLRRLYSRETLDADYGDAFALFQTYMVLPIGSTILSRRVKVELPSGGFSASALEHLKNLNLSSSIQVLQCTLLLLMYALNSPSLGLNMWYLHHQCVAVLIDLGLYRSLPPGNWSADEEQLRRRVFICIYTIDQTLAAIMRRPCALRDEDCSCRVGANPVSKGHPEETWMSIVQELTSAKVPDHINDADLFINGFIPQPGQGELADISNAIHLFHLARMNSRLSISSIPDPSTYTLPTPIDLGDWQQRTLSRLRQWASEIPPQTREGSFVAELSEIEYHNTVLFLLLLSPALRKPSEETLKTCYESAVQCLRIYNRLYKTNILAFSWVTVHSVFLASLNILYYVWIVPDSQPYEDTAGHFSVRPESRLRCSECYWRALAAGEAMSGCS